MASQIKVNEIIKQSGSSITIGESGDTINLAGTAYAEGEKNTPAFRATAAGTTTVANDTATKIAFTTEVFDVGSGYDATNDKFVVPAGEGGKYCFTATAKINPATSGGLIGSGMRLTVGGSASAGMEEIHFMNVNPSNAESMNVNGILDLSAADEVEVYAYYQDSGGSAGTITGGGAEVNTVFFGYKLAE